MPPGRTEQSAPVASEPDWKVAQVSRFRSSPNQQIASRRPPAAQRAINEFERMNAQTDAQLSAKGMDRADVARVVFEKHFV